MIGSSDPDAGLTAAGLSAAGLSAAGGIETGAETSAGAAEWTATTWGWPGMRVGWPAMTADELTTAGGGPGRIGISFLTTAGGALGMGNFAPGMDGRMCLYRCCCCCGCGQGGGMTTWLGGCAVLPVATGLPVTAGLPVATGWAAFCASMCLRRTAEAEPVGLRGLELAPRP